jgi:hypothetical protein
LFDPAGAGADLFRDVTKGLIIGLDLWQQHAGELTELLVVILIAH